MSALKEIIARPEMRGSQESATGTKFDIEINGILGRYDHLQITSIRVPDHSMKRLDRRKSGTFSILAVAMCITAIVSGCSSSDMTSSAGPAEKAPEPERNPTIRDIAMGRYWIEVFSKEKTFAYYRTGNGFMQECFSKSDSDCRHDVVVRMNKYGNATRECAGGPDDTPNHEERLICNSTSSEKNWDGEVIPPGPLFYSNNGTLNLRAAVSK
jgi:hypothetical protein